jgi:hypothetical protein
MTPEQIKQVQADERARWKEAFNHSNGVFQKDLVINFLLETEMTAAQIHAVLDFAPVDPEASIASTAASDLQRGAEVAAALTGRKVPELDPALAEFSRPALQADEAPSGVSSHIPFVMNEAELKDYNLGEAIGRELLGQWSL